MAKDNLRDAATALHDAARTLQATAKTILESLAATESCQEAVAALEAHHDAAINSDDFDAIGRAEKAVDAANARLAGSITAGRARAARAAGDAAKAIDRVAKAHDFIGEFFKKS